MNIINLIQKQSHRFKLDGPKRLRFLFDEVVEGEARMNAVEKTLEKLIT